MNTIITGTLLDFEILRVIFAGDTQAFSDVVFNTRCIGKNMKKALITGCAGFIGSHMSKYFLDNGFTVIGIDNLSRNGSHANLRWLKSINSDKFIFHNEDIRNFSNIVDVFKKHNGFELIIHEAGQVAVTTSVANPREDFEINALGTFNMLEAFRLFSPDAFFEFASTNKVYGNMCEAGVTEKNGRYAYTDINGIKEDYNLDLHSPYGCSKGAADQYVRDYSRIYGLKTVVLRQSCIYGTRQFGIEDQGWVAWFTIASILKEAITIYGDGKQVRDILWIDDLVEAYAKLYENADKVSGEIFNVGGGNKNTLSLLELVEALKNAGTLEEQPEHSDWRPGDQKIFMCDISKIKAAIDWEPRTTPSQGLDKLIQWVLENEKLLREILLSSEPSYKTLQTELSAFNLGEKMPCAAAVGQA